MAEVIKKLKLLLFKVKIVFRDAWGQDHQVSFSQYFDDEFTHFNYDRKISILDDDGNLKDLAKIE